MVGRFSSVGSVALGLVIVGLAGCGGGSSSVKLYPVTGTVTVDGQPAEGVALVFHPSAESGQVCSATSDASGKFAVFFQAEKGMPEGSYRVTASWPEPLKEGFGGMGEMPDQPDRLKSRYAILGRSKITFEVGPSTAELEPIALTTR